MTHAVPYRGYTRLMTVSLVVNVLKWLSVFPSKNGVFKTLSRATIVAGKSLPDIYDKRITFGSYALVYMYWHQKQYEEE